MKTIPELFHLLSDLVSINSINPDLVPGAPGEGAHYIAQWLKRAGLEVYVHEPVPGRPNVVGIARGSGGGRNLMLNGHIDTVGVAGMSQPHTPRLENGRLYGRGAYDMKGGVAAAMWAVAAAKTRNLRGDVIFTAVMDEEYAGLGTLDIVQHYRADAAVIAEPTEYEMIVAHKGFVWLEVETQGVAAHGSLPDLGIDAIAKMGRVLVAVEALDQRLRAKPTHPLLGSGSVHASLISGGQELSSYPARCTLAIERRTVPGETAETVEAEFQAILDQAHQADSTFQAVIRRGVARSPMSTPSDSPIIQVLRQAAAQVIQRTPPFTGAPYWTDAATLTAAAIPAVLFGPSGAGAHAEEEWVDLQSVVECAEIYLATVVGFCG